MVGRKQFYKLQAITSREILRRPHLGWLLFGASRKLFFPCRGGTRFWRREHDRVFFGKLLHLWFSGKQVSSRSQSAMAGNSRTAGDGLDYGQVDGQENRDNDPTHDHKDRRLKRSRQLFEADLRFGVIEDSYLVKHFS